jgi:phosphatidylinositol alpha-1,6-mannosyltransferase
MGGLRDPGVAKSATLRHLLVTNDFPPKVGGIQNYLWELWRRLPADDVTVLTSPYRDADVWDARQKFRVERIREPVLLPHPLLARRIRRLAAEVGARAVVLDPGLPLGALGPSLGIPYAVVLHGAEVTVPGRLPVSRQLLSRVLGDAGLLIAAGGYPASEALHALGDRTRPPVVEIPPGVDPVRFVPLPAIERAAARGRLDLPATGPLVVSVSRLVPRKGMDTLIEAASRLAPSHPDLTVAIAGAGRDHPRLEQLIRRSGAPVRLLGRVTESDLPDLYACADVFSLLCRTRWGGLEQEGFGIVFLEAAAAGVAAVAGRSGGAAEAVVDGRTGLVVDPPDDAAKVADAIAAMLADPVRTRVWGQEARRRAEEDFSYDRLAGRLADALEKLGT